MSNIISSITEYEEIKGTSKGYYDQYKNTAKTISVGDEFVVMPKTWQESIVQIIFTDNTIALGVAIKGMCVGSKDLYVNKGVKLGWRYNDDRAAYRLQTITK